MTHRCYLNRLIYVPSMWQKRYIVLTSSSRFSFASPIIKPYLSSTRGEFLTRIWKPAACDIAAFIKFWRWEFIETAQNYRRLFRSQIELEFLEDLRNSNFLLMTAETIASHFFKSKGMCKCFPIPISIQRV